VDPTPRNSELIRIINYDRQHGARRRALRATYARARAWLAGLRRSERAETSSSRKWRTPALTWGRRWTVPAHVGQRRL